MKRDPSSTKRASDAEKTSRDQLRSALKRAESDPGDDAAWDELEALAVATQETDEIAAVFRSVLARGPERELVTRVGQRALRFLEEWYAGDANLLVDLLESILALDAGADWALERLTILRSVREQWHELLTAYDRVLEGLPDSPRRRKILQDAAAVARDSGDLARAVSYLRSLFEVAPATADVAAELERLLDKLGDHVARAQVLGKRLGVLSGNEAVEVGQRLAGIYLDHLREPAKALDELARVLSSASLDDGDDSVACQLTERILGDSSLPHDLRQRALVVLRKRYMLEGRNDRLVSALRVATQFANVEELQALAGETADLLEGKDDLPAAREQMVELVGLRPEDAAARARLRFLAEVTASPDAYVRGVVAAASASKDASLQVTLWLEAAQMQEARGDSEEAVGFYRRAMASAAASPEQLLLTLRKLAVLLKGEGVAEERLKVLAKQAELEASPRVRRALYGEAADLARAQGQIDRALALWEKRLGADPNDAKALGQTIEILERAERWKELVAALARRAAAEVPTMVKRADLLHIAAVQRDQLDDPDQAIAALDRALGLAPDDVEVEAGLLDLFAKVGRWKELLALGGHATLREQNELVALFVRLGDACRSKLSDGEGAARWYGRAIAIEPRTPGLRDALHALADGEAKQAAVGGLVRMAEATDDWQELLALLPQRLALASDDQERARLCREAAVIEEVKAKQPKIALSHQMAILKLRPKDVDAEAEVLRLAEATGELRQVAQGLEAVAAADGLDGDRKVHLLLLAASLFADKAQDNAAALACYGRAFKAAPANLEARAGVIRLGSALGDWQTCIDAALAEPFDATALFETRLPVIVKAATAAGDSGLRQMGKTLSAAVARKPGLPVAVRRAVEERIADYPVDGALAWTEKALLRARDYDPAHLPTLRRLAEVQRGRGGKPLFETLMQIAGESPRELDGLVEALELVARDRKDPAATRLSLATLFDRSAALLRSGQTALGQTTAADGVLRATAGLATLLGGSSDKNDVRRAIDYLLEASRLPLPGDAIKSLRARAGELAVDVDKKLARELLRQSIEQDPKNRAAAQALARLLEEADMLADLMTLRRRELDETADSEERLALRLEVARLGEVVESRSGRLEMLVANLDERPGHAPTLAALTSLLRSHGRPSELADILVGQARKLEEQKDVLLAAELWGQAADIFAGEAADQARAIAAYERVVALTSLPSAMEALARLYLEAGEPLQAAGWLEQRAAAGEPADKVGAVARLADTYVKAGQPHRAVAALERCLAEMPSAAELWQRLCALHREGGRDEALVHALTDMCLGSQDREQVVGAAREVLEVCQHRLHEPGRAVPALERALALAPDDRSLHLALADALRAAGAFAKARDVLEGLLQAYGRRQSRERAALHLRIALVAREEKNVELAAKNLELAAAVLFDSVEVQLGLGEVAEERGDWERAEKAYRTLLVLARRGQAGETSMTGGEVLIRLRRVALRQNQSAQAAEHLDLAVARALHGPAEARRIQAALLGDGDHATLLALLAKRRAAAAHVSDEAQVVCELAEVLEHIGRREEALSALLDILARVPDHASAHRLAHALAIGVGRADAYLGALAAATERLRRSDDANCLADLLLRAAEVAEQDLAAFDRAMGFLRRAERTDRRGAEVASACARVAVKAQDLVEHKRALGKLRQLLELAPDTAGKADISYRLAEAEMWLGETREQGIAHLAQAVELGPDIARATGIVHNARVPDAALARILPVYEKVARASKDPRLLFDFLERKSALPDVAMSELREGVELALSLGEGDRAERMLARAIAVASAAPGGLLEGIWAVADLARRLRDRGDLSGAARILEDARVGWTNPRLTTLVRETAKAAADSPEQGEVAIRLYQELRELYPTDREVWVPLMGLINRLGQRDALAALVTDLAQKLMSRSDRSAVRMTWARFLLARDEADPALATLHDVLREEPLHADALTLLADLYEQRGELAQAVSLLSDALSKTDESTGGAARAMLSRRLGDLVKKADPAQAKAVYRSALRAALPDAGIKRSLQGALAEILTADDEAGERAGLCEELLLGEEGEAAGAQALALFELRLRLGDDAGAERALALGRERSPGDAQIFDQLARFYSQRERWSDAVVLLSHEANRVADRGEATRLLRKIARLQREKLGEPKAAAQTLRNAVQANPSDLDLVRELCDALVEAQEAALAVGVVTEILAECDSPAVRIGLLRLRAEMSARGHDDEAAVRDLDEAIALGATDAASDLAAALSRVAGRGIGAGNRELARAATLRLADVLRATGDQEQADQVLFRWVEACPDDRELLHQMRDMFEGRGNWEGAANVWARLVHLEQGEVQANAALALADAYQKLGQPEKAIPWLASVLSRVPGNRALETRLAALYTSTGRLADAARLRTTMADSEPDEKQRYRLYLEIAESLRAVGQGKDSVYPLEKAVALPAADRATRILLLDAYLEGGVSERAAKLLAELLAGAKGMRAEELASLYHRQSKLAALVGDRDGQLQALKKALDADRRSVAIADELAGIAEAIGDDDLALRALRVVAASPVKDAKVLGHAYLRQARIAHRAKDRARAIIFVKRALQEDPELEEARALLDQLR